MKLPILYNDALKEYDFGPGHPFRGERYEAFPLFLRQKLNEAHYEITATDPVTDYDLRRICKEEYIEFTRSYFRAANAGLQRSGDFFRYHSGDNRPLGTPGKIEEAARLIVGQAKLATDLVQQNEFQKVVSIGGGMHHAKPGYGEGFCIYNDVAFAARYLMDVHGLGRVLILDTDAHAGNGTCEYFYEEPRVLFIDIHQNPLTLYPGTGFVRDIGTGHGMGFTVNVPVPVNAGYDSYRLIFEEVIQPLGNEFKPQAIIRNGGSDPHFEDGLTQLGLPLEGFRLIGEKVREMSGICDGKVIDLIASGYNERILPHAWLALIAGLAGLDLNVKEQDPTPSRPEQDRSLDATRKVIQELKQVLRPYWKCLS